MAVSANFSASLSLVSAPDSDSSSDEDVAHPSRREIIHRVRVRLLESFETDSRAVGYLSGERQIAADLGDVSRVPIREALTVLRALGIIIVDQEKRQYRACRVSLGVGDDQRDGPLQIAASGFDILKRELLGDIRTLVSFIAEARRRDWCDEDSISDPLGNLRRLVQLHSDTEWEKIDAPAGIISINDLVAAAAHSLRLGRTGDSIKAHLDVLEFSVANARHEALIESPESDVSVFESRLVKQRAIGIRHFFKRCLTEDPTAEGFLEARVEDFRAYLDCVRRTIKTVSQQEEPVPVPVISHIGGLLRQFVGRRAVVD